MSSRRQNCYGKFVVRRKSLIISSDDIEDDEMSNDGLTPRKHVKPSKEEDEDEDMTDATRDDVKNTAKTRDRRSDSLPRSDRWQPSMSPVASDIDDEFPVTTTRNSGGLQFQQPLITDGKSDNQRMPPPQTPIRQLPQSQRQSSVLQTTRATIGRTSQLQAQYKVISPSARTGSTSHPVPTPSKHPVRDLARKYNSQKADDEDEISEDEALDVNVTALNYSLNTVFAQSQKEMEEDAEEAEEEHGTQSQVPLPTQSLSANKCQYDQHSEALIDAHQHGLHDLIQTAFDLADMPDAKWVTRRKTNVAS